MADEFCEYCGVNLDNWRRMFAEEHYCDPKWWNYYKKHCKHCGGLLIKDDDEPGGTECISCSRPHDKNGEIILAQEIKAGKGGRK